MSEALKTSDLQGFIGTEKYHRLALTKRVVFTDGCSFVASKGKAYWLMEELAMGVMNIVHQKPEECFVSVHLIVNKKDDTAVLRFEDGNYECLYSREIPYTDFPLEEIQFFAQDAGDFWVVMLTSEY